MILVIIMGLWYSCPVQQPSDTDTGVYLAKILRRANQNSLFEENGVKH